MDGPWTDYAPQASAPVADGPWVDFAPPVDAPSSLPPGKKTGYGANLAAAVVEGAAGVGNVLSDPFGNLVGKPIATGIQFAHDALAPVFGYERFPADIRNRLLGEDVPQPVTRLADAAGRAIGAPALEDVVPGSTGEKIVRDYVPASIGMAALGGGSGITRNAVVNPLLGIAGQAGGQAAGSVVPEWGAPAAELGGNVAGMAAASMGASAVARNFPANRNALLGEALPEMPEQLRGNVTAKQATTAGRLLGDEATDLPAARAILANPPEPLVPGDNPTTAKLTGDPGIAAAEYTASRGVGPISERVTKQQAAFADQISKQNDARVGAIKSIEPDADPGAFPAAVKRQAAASDAASAADLAATKTRAEGDIAAVSEAGQTRINAAQTAIAKATAEREAASSARVAPLEAAAGQTREAMGGDLPANAHGTLGTALRTPVAEANQAAWGRIHDLADKVDPDGTLGAMATPVRSAADEIVSGRGKYATKFSPTENDVLALARSMPDQLHFRDLKEFRTQLTSAISEARQKGEPTGVFSNMIKSVDDAMNNAVLHQAEADAAKVASGAMRPEDAISARFRGVVDSGENANRADSGRGNAPAGGPPDGGTGSGGTSVASGAGQGSGGRGGGDRSVAAGETVGRRPETLHDFVISRGGVQDPGGDFRSADLQRIHHRGGGRLINPNGMHPDKMREAAVEAGFLPQGADINAFSDAMQSQRPVYRIDETADASVRAQRAHEASLTDEAHFNSGMAVVEAASQLGVQLSRGENDHAVLLHMMGLDAEEAIRNAARSGEEAAFQRNADHNVVGDPGVPLAAKQAELGVTEPGPQLTPMDAEAAARYAAYRAAVRDRGARFESAPGVGQILEQGRWSGDFKTSSAEIPNIIVRAGAEGADVGRAYLAAGGDPAALSEAAAFSLRQHPGVMRADGSLDPAKVEGWAQRRGSFLSVVPETAAKINDVVQAQRALDTARAAETAAAKAGAASDAARLKAVVTEADATLKQVTRVAQGIVDDAAAARAAQISARASSAVGRFLGDAEPVPALWKILNDKTMGAAKARELRAAVGGDPALQAGLARMVAQGIEQNLVGVPKGATSAEGGIAANAYQNFLKHAEPALAELLSPADHAKLKATGEMMARDFRSAQVGVGSSTGQLTATRGTVAKVSGVLFRNVSGGSVGAAVGAWLGGHVGLAEAGAVVGASTGVALAQVVQKAREAGIQNVADLKAAAYLNPELWRILTTAATEKNRASLLGALSATLGRASLIKPPQGSDDRRPAAPPSNALLR